MMNKSALLLLLILKINFSSAQEVDLSHVVENLTISEDGRYTLVKGINDYTILNNETKEKVLETQLIKPENRVLENLDNISGTDMLLFGALNRAISFEYSTDTTIIKGYDLISGEQIYQLDTITLGVSYAEEFARGVMLVAGAEDRKIRTGNDVELQNLRMQGKREGTVVLNNTTLKTCIHPINELNAMLIVAKEGVLFFDVVSGAIKWNQVDFPSGIAEAIYLPEQNSIVLANAYATGFNKTFAKKVIFNIDASTGELLWESEYSGNYKPNRSYVVGDRLLLDYFGMEIFDLQTGENLGMNVDQQRVMKFSQLFNGASATYAPGQEVSTSPVVAYMPPIITDGFAYYSVGMVQGEPWTYGNDKHIQKIDLLTGDIVWTSEKIVGINTEMTQMELVNNQLILKYKGLGLKSQYELFWLDIENGKILKKVEKIKTDRNQELVDFQYEGNYLIDYDKEGMKYYDLKTAEVIKSEEKDKLPVNTLWLNNDILYFYEDAVEVLKNQKATSFTIEKPESAYTVDEKIIIEGEKELLVINSSTLKEISRKSIESNSFIVLTEQNTVIEQGEQSVTFTEL
ncbi:PQQ-binding-like beta-propeller repeat protein [Marivirga sp.]|uniref:outer membrane protein assembly factor BamB family protein n=1 Tax=Marivirga sp. TaxID=2018662 RepID=UPI002D809BF0|nr:PQQ-binding-like beta-propeller repeat protein [Marivirga sp.]